MLHFSISFIVFLFFFCNSVVVLHGLLPTHISGQWSEDLHKTQLNLVKQVKGEWLTEGLVTEHGRWWRALTRDHLAHAHHRDEGIHAQLQKLEQCSSRMKNGLVNKGWTREDVLRDLKYFMTFVYPRRPLKFNPGGMRLSHSFGCWWIAKQLQPKWIIESGVNKGHSTWLFRQAVPNVTIFSLDPNPGMMYWDNGTIYFTGRGFKKPGHTVYRFTDFSAINWSFVKNRSQTLILFDDHQSSIKRIRQAQEMGFKHLMFDDNWIPLTGDCYSPKHVCDESGGGAMRDPGLHIKGVYVKDNFQASNHWISMEDHLQNRQFLLSSLKFYYESPPVLFIPSMLESVPIDDERLGLRNPSLRLLKYYTEQFVAPPIVQTQAEFDDFGALLTALPPRELSYYVGFVYLELA